MTNSINPLPFYFTIGRGEMKGVFIVGKRIGTAKWGESQNRWRIDVQKEGRQRSFYSSTPGRKGQREANEKADQWLDDGIDGSTKVSAMCDRFIQSLKDRKTSEAHWTIYERFLRLYSTPKIGKKRIGSITENDLQDVINYAHSVGNSGAGLAKKTLKNIRACLRSFIKYCRITKVTRLYPEALYIPNDAKESNKGSLQPDDIKLLFAKNKTLFRGQEIEDWYVHAYRFETIVGLRPGELIGLDINDIKNTVCSIRRSFNERGVETLGKNQNARRQFEIPAIGLKEIKAQRKMLLAAGVKTTILFPTPDGDRTTQKVYRSHWKRYRDYNKISPKTPYELRHTFFSATKALPADLIKPVGGHSNSFDGASYKHELAGEAHRAATMINQVFENILK